MRKSKKSLNWLHADTFNILPFLFAGGGDGASGGPDADLADTLQRTLGNLAQDTQDLQVSLANTLFWFM